MKELTSPTPRYATLSADPETSIVDDLMARALVQKDLLSIAAGFTDNACLPLDIVGDAVSELVREGRYDILQYGTNQGRHGLREKAIACLAENPHEKALDALPSPDSVLISNGSQQTLYLAMQTLCEPGDIVLVQAPTYFVFVELARGLGIELRVLPTHEDGSLDLDALPAALDSIEESGESSRLRAVYLVSYFANPTGYSLSLEEKVGVANALAAKQWYLPIIEDAAYRDVWFESPHDAPSILSIESLAKFPCLYLGTFTKPFATGMKVGYGVFSDSEWCQRCARLKSHQDFGTANFNQSVIEYILEKEDWARFQGEMRAHYLAKKEAFIQAMKATQLEEMGFRWMEPRGGLLLWLRGPDGLDTGMDSPLFEAAIANKVLYVPGAVCMPEAGGTVSTIRLSFGALDPELFPEALARFERAVIACS
ncbi:MAG: PLP-dependent aminotransferase family protein [Opitutales bacterium]